MLINLLKNIATLLDEYFLIFKLHLSALFKKVPESWNEGQKGDVILVQGFCEHWYFLHHISTELNKLGYRIHVLPELNYNTHSIRTSLDILEKYISQHNLQNIHLLSHSKGGLVAKKYVDVAMNNQVNYCFSITTPYQGSIFGYASILSLKELVGTSDVIKEINTNTTNVDKVINIYAALDNHIIPNRSAFLHGARNIQVPIIGHTRILHDPRTVEIIKNFLTLQNNSIGT